MEEGTLGGVDHTLRYPLALGYVIASDGADPSGFPAVPRVFGAATGLVVLLLVVGAVGLVVAAFAQGRSISFWPPTIGARPAAGGSPAGRPPDPPAAGPSESSGLVHGSEAKSVVEFDPRSAADFYQVIATRYDQRNSGALLDTQREIVRRISARALDRPDLRVLDLGGGTGREIATHFFDHPTIRWSYVDFCSAMVDQFRRNIRGTTLADRVTVHIEDVTSAIGRLPGGSFDVVLLSFVLSSMPTWPDFRAVGSLLAPGGVLVVADIDPAYTALKPCYEVAVDGRTYSLRTTPVRPLRILRKARAAGLVLHEVVEVESERREYSFVEVFERCR